MSNPLSTFVIVLIIISLALVLLSSYLLVVYKNTRMKLLFLFWLTYLVYFSYTFFSFGSSNAVIASVTFTWPIRLWVIKKIIEDMVDGQIERGWHKFVIGGTSLATLTFILLNSSFQLMTFPIAAGVFIVGTSISLGAYRKLRNKKEKRLHLLLLVVFTLIFTHLLSYPFMRPYPLLAFFGFGLVLLTTIMVAILIPMILFYEEEKENTKNKVNSLLEINQHTKNLARILLTLRDQCNTPLQNLIIQLHLIKKTTDPGAINLELFERSLEKLTLSMKQYNKLESLIDWNEKNIMSESEINAWVQQLEQDSKKSNQAFN